MSTICFLQKRRISSDTLRESESRKHGQTAQGRQIEEKRQSETDRKTKLTCIIERSKQNPGIRRICIFDAISGGTNSTNKHLNSSSGHGMMMMMMMMMMN